MNYHTPARNTTDASYRDRPGNDAAPARPGRAPSAPAHVGENDDPYKTPPAPTLVMPGPQEQVKDEIAQIGVEGRPADGKAGPGSLLLTLAALFCLLVIASVIVGMTVGWATAAAVFGVGCLGLLLNPLVAATLLRARDREDVAEHHLPPEKRRHP
jgi:hypothetical protein